MRGQGFTTNKQLSSDSNSFPIKRLRMTMDPAFLQPESTGRRNSFEEEEFECFSSSRYDRYSFMTRQRTHRETPPARFSRAED